MKKLSLILAVVCGVAGTTGVAQKTPSVPETILPGGAANEAQRVSGAGLCRVHFDHEGRADSVAMVRSTGSAALDEDALRSARRNWCGLPDRTVSVPVRYSAVPVQKSHGTIRYDTPIPTYPIWAERQKFSGTCLVQVLFDAQGSANFAVVAKSSGNAALDKFTVRHALAHWKSSGGEESVLTYPVTYLYRERQETQTQHFTAPGVDSYTPH